MFQGEAASLADRYGLAAGLPVATAVLLKKQIQYRFSHGIGIEICLVYYLLSISVVKINIFFVIFNMFSLV